MPAPVAALTTPLYKLATSETPRCKLLSECVVAAFARAELVDALAAAVAAPFAADTEHADTVKGAEALVSGNKKFTRVMAQHSAGLLCCPSCPVEQSTVHQAMAEAFQDGAKYRLLSKVPAGQEFWCFIEQCVPRSTAEHALLTCYLACLHAHFHGVQGVDRALAGCTGHCPRYYIMCWLVGCWGGC